MVFPKSCAKVKIKGRITKPGAFRKSKFSIVQKPDYSPQAGMRSRVVIFNFRNATNSPGRLKYTGKLYWFEAARFLKTKKRKTMEQFTLPALLTNLSYIKKSAIWFT